MSGCTVRLDLGLGREIVCDEPGDRVMAGCEHEHVFEETVCPDHQRKAELGALNCRECRTCREPHECRWRVIRHVQS